MIRVSKILIYEPGDKLIFCQVWSGFIIACFQLNCRYSLISQDCTNDKLKLTFSKHKNSASFLHLANDVELIHEHLSCCTETQINSIEWGRMQTWVEVFGKNKLFLRFSPFWLIIQFPVSFDSNLCGLVWVWNHMQYLASSWQSYQSFGK